MWKHETPGRFGDAIMVIAAILVVGGFCVLGFQGWLFLRDSNFTNINLSDVFDLINFQRPTWLVTTAPGLCEFIWNIPVSVFLILGGVALPFIHGALGDLWYHGRKTQADRRKAKAKKKALEKAD